MPDSVLQALLRSTLFDIGVAALLVVPAYWRPLRWPVLVLAMSAAAPLLFVRPTTGLMLSALSLAMWIGVWKRIPGWITISVAALGVAAMLPYSTIGLGRSLVHLEMLKSSFPRQDLKERLNYEPAGLTDEEPRPGLSPRSVLATEPEDRLVANNNPRAEFLRKLHNGAYDHFVASPGQGHERLLYDWEENLFPPVPLRTPIAPTQPERSVYREDFASNAEREDSGPMLPRPDDRFGQTAADGANDFAIDPLGQHRRAKGDFLDPAAWGFVTGRQTALGFEPHAFHQNGLFSKSANLAPDAEWRLVSLQLVSLLKHEEPVAYVSPGLPDMQTLGKAPVRPLESFEIRALERLHRGEELVADEEPGQIFMLGAIRAGRACRACHSVPEGFLLGAFTYRLERGCRGPVQRTSALQ